MVECPEFRSLCRLLRPGMQDMEILHHHKLREGIIEHFKTEFAYLKAELSVRYFVCWVKLYLFLQNSAGRISLTTDIWSNKQMRSYLAVTAHWLSINNTKLTLRAALIGFHHMKGKHSGPSIARAIFSVVERAGITDKVCLH
jgi:hypothetical protein